MSVDVGTTRSFRPMSGDVLLKKNGAFAITLEVNHHLKNGGSFWKMINPY